MEIDAMIDLSDLTYHYSGGDGPALDRVTRTAPEERHVGVVFQDFALFPHLTVQRNVAFGIARLTRHERDRRVRECIELLGIGHLASRYPHEAYELADQMVLLRDGRVEQTGAPCELDESPKTRYVAHFFGPVNEIPIDSPLGRRLAGRDLPLIGARRTRDRRAGLGRRGA